MIYQKYRDKIDSKVYWQSMKEKLANDIAEDNDNVEHEDDARTAREYIGSILSLAPSGKFYTAWAMSNVEPCECCGGTGKIGGVSCSKCHGCGSVEVYKDQEYFSALDDVAEKYGLYIEQGEGDATDLFVCLRDYV